MLNHPIIPQYVFIVGIVGISFLFIALILWFVFYFSFYNSVNNSNEPPPDKNTGYYITLYMSSILGGLGFILSCILFYGLYLIHSYKPKNIKRGDKLVESKQKVTLPKVDPYRNLNARKSLYAPRNTSF